MKIAGSGEGRPSFGSRACRCRIEAPASAAAIASAAISSGVSGRYSDIVGVWMEPVTAQVMMTLPSFAMAPAPSQLRCAERYPLLSRHKPVGRVSPLSG